MTETILCPGCSTRFALRTERVRVGIRRAKCFKCETIFEIGATVERLLGLTAAPVPEPAPAAPGLAEGSPFAAFEALGGPAAAEATEALASPFLDAGPGDPPSLTLGDLEGSEDEIMEKTLVILPPPEAEPAQAAAEPAEAESEAGASGFSSAKDAIAKLMGGAPMPPPPPERRHLSARSPMDVEATLSALEDTLAGTQPLKVQPPAVETASTVKLSAQEIQAAMAALPQPPAPPAPPAPMMPPPPQAVRPLPSAAADTAQGGDLLKIQVETETLNNLTLDQVTGWIEQGRIREYHMVARQFSDHWIEANKVPALRPAFERKRREDTGKPPELPTPPPDLQPARKSLFGGLFGRN